MNERAENLTARSTLLRKLREFFYARGFIEVETPLLSPEVIPELHIEPPRVGESFLQASPELHMKRLVAEGMPRIFQVTRSFRADEVGELHNPEFTILEWYRVGDDLEAGMKLLAELARAMLGTERVEYLSYFEAFLQHLQLNPFTVSCEELVACAEQHGVTVPANMPADDRDEWLNLLLATEIEPHLGQAVPTILFDYPASQASLARIVERSGGIHVAERFELYYRGVELANGFHELTDAAELRARLMHVNERRVQLGRDPLPLPESLLAAMAENLPACSGCALGIDRLVMLACGVLRIADVRAFSADEHQKRP